MAYSWCIHPLVLIIILMSMFIAPICVRLLTLLHHSQLVWHWRICQLRWEQYPKSSDESPSNGGRLLISAVSRPQASKRWGFIGEQQQQPCWMVVTITSQPLFSFQLLSQFNEHSVKNFFFIQYWGRLWGLLEGVSNWDLKFNMEGEGIFLLTLYTLTSGYIFSILFSKGILRCRRREFV